MNTAEARRVDYDLHSGLIEEREEVAPEDMEAEFEGLDLTFVQELHGWGYDALVSTTDDHGETRYYMYTAAE